MLKLIRGIFKRRQICFIGRHVKLGRNVRLSPMVFIDDDVSIGNDVFIGYGCVIRTGTKIGSNCTFGHLTVVEREVRIGDRVGFHAQCHVTQGTVIEDDVFIAPFYLGTNTNNIDHGRGINPPVEAPVIKRAARISAGVIIVPGKTIGENSFVGAGSLVTKDVPDKEIWFGCPATKKGNVPNGELL